MRKKIIIGNWKMNKTIAETKDFVTEIEPVARDLKAKKVIVGIAPSYLSLQTALKGAKKLIIAAQNVHYLPSGAYTGEVSIPQLQELGVSYAIVGHSERRQYYAETNETCNEKLKALIQAGITPIYCVGETLAEYENGYSEQVVALQLIQGLKDVSLDNEFIIAYEPVWAIGTGKNATSEIAERVCAYIRKVIAKEYSRVIANKVLIQYGGSVKPENVREYLSRENIDGALVGGASLKVETFKALLDNV
jgi:triosephosphate isomerase